MHDGAIHLVAMTCADVRSGAPVRVRVRLRVRLRVTIRVRVRVRVSPYNPSSAAHRSHRTLPSPKSHPTVALAPTVN